MTYAFVDLASNGVTGSGTAVTLSRAYALHDNVIVWTRASNTITPTVTDGTNTYVQIGTSLNDPNTNSTYAMFYLKDAAAGTFTVSFNTGSTVFRALGVARYTGLDNAAAAQTSNKQEQTAPGVGAGAVTSTNMTPTSQPAMLIGFAYDDTAASAISVSSGTDRGTLSVMDTAFGTATRVQDQRLTSTSAVATTFTASVAGDNYVTFGAVFTEAASATIPVVTMQYPRRVFFPV